MNLVGLLTGDVGDVAANVAGKVIDKLMPSNAPKFLDVFKKANEARRLTLDELHLSKEEELSLIEMRDFAMTKGIDSIEVEIDGQRYELNTEEFTFVPLVSVN